MTLFYFSLFFLFFLVPKLKADSIGNWNPIHHTICWLDGPYHSTASSFHGIFWSVSCTLSNDHLNLALLFGLPIVGWVPFCNQSNKEWRNWLRLMKRYACPLLMLNRLVGRGSNYYACSYFKPWKLLMHLTGPFSIFMPQ